MGAIATYETADRLRTSVKTSISPAAFIKGEKPGIAVVLLKSWHHHEWEKQPDGSYQRGRLIAKHTDIVFAVERDRSQRIRVLACVAEQKVLFSEEHSEFTFERNSTDAELREVPYSGLGTLGAMLRRILFELEGGKSRAQRNCARDGKFGTPWRAPRLNPGQDAVDKSTAAAKSFAAAAQPHNDSMKEALKNALTS